MTSIPAAPALLLRSKRKPPWKRQRVQHQRSKPHMHFVRERALHGIASRTSTLLGTGACTMLMIA